MDRGLVILDRDGVLNSIVIDPEQGTINSPMNVLEVSVKPWAASCIKKLNDLGFVVSIATNQPASAKGTTTKKNLEDVHLLILNQIQSDGGIIHSSQICFHKSEDDCLCRKPRPGLLKSALEVWGQRKSDSEIWMVGDGVTDIQAGVAVGAKTAFLGPRKCDACLVFEKMDLKPDFWGSDLKAFTNHLVLRS